MVIQTCLSSSLGQTGALNLNPIICEVSNNDEIFPRKSHVQTGLVPKMFRKRTSGREFHIFLSEITFAYSLIKFQVANTT